MKDTRIGDAMTIRQEKMEKSVRRQTAVINAMQDMGETTAKKVAQKMDESVYDVAPIILALIRKG